MMESSRVRIEDRGAVRTITLCRPEVHNAFDDGLIAALAGAFRGAATAQRVRVVVLAAEGRSFCAGADLSWMRGMVEASQADNVLDSMRLAELFETLDACPKPVVARVQGAALGGGVGLVACADIAIASSRARFALAEVKLGLAPAVISPYVLRRIGETAARRYFLTGELFGADEALRIGLVSEVVPDDALDGAVDEVCRALLGGGPEALARCKELIRVVPATAPERRAAYTAEVIAALRVSEQGQEGMRAFLEKREPAWATVETEAGR